jgi:hypothetical protein
MPKDEKEEELKIVDRRRFKIKEDGSVEEREEEQQKVEKSNEIKQDRKVEEKKIEDEEPDFVQLPPVDFKTFIASLATTVLINLGHIPEPSTGEPLKNLDVARYHIDIIDMLAEKTRGNLSPDEEEFIKEILKDLKLRYIEEAKSSN